MKKPKFLIVDDHDGFRESLVESRLLSERYKILEAYNGEMAIEIVSNNPDISCILLDYDFKGRYGENTITGLDVMKHLASTSPHIPIIMMSGITEERGKIAIESIKQHAVAFMDKPFHVKTLVEKLESITHSKPQADSENEAQNILSSMGFVTSSLVIAKVCRDAYEASENDMNLMIIGETGTGKTLLARTIHQLSSRGKSQFVEYNCGNVSGNIDTFNSQIFGHVKGAFTGATDNKIGVLESASEGTVFFDDITSMPLDIQRGLLQAIEDKKYRRLGDEKNILTFNSRIIAATNYNLNDAISEKMLREDLKFRLCGELIKIPPLRMRVEDIPAIINTYLSNTENNNLKVREISLDVFPLLQRQPWLGNVRQLVNVITRASNHEKSSSISLSTVKNELWKEYGIDDLEKPDDFMPEIEGDLESTINSIRKKFITRALQKSNGNVSLAARELGYNNHHGLQYWVDKLGIG